MVTNRKRVSITLSPDQDALLHVVAKQSGMTVTGFVKSIVIQQLNQLIFSQVINPISSQVKQSPSNQVNQGTAPNLHRHKGNKKRR